MKKVIIAGSRSFDNYELLKDKCDLLLSNLLDIQIVCGGAKGADMLGKKYAYEKGYSSKIFLPDWQKHGRSAGILRNIEMADYADYLIAFWDNESRGTKHMIETAKKNGLKVRVIYYRNLE